MPDCTIQIRVTPRASKSEIARWQGDVLLVRIAAPPVEGAANKAVIELLSASLGVRKSAIAISSGERSRVKRVAIEGLTVEEFRARLPGISSDSR